MEKVDLDYLRKQWKNEVKYYWDSMQNEILEYIEMLKVTKYGKAQKKLNKSKEEILKYYSLTEERLKDPLFVPEMLDFLEYIKKINYDFFPKNWNSDNYNHYDHASYIYNTLIPKLTPLAEKILDFKVNQYNKLFDKEELIIPKKKFIVRDFVKFGLINYEFFVDLINSIAYDEKFYVLLPNLLRTLFENILNDIFSNSLKNKYKYLYFDKNRGRIADFSILIEVLNLLSKVEYKDRIRSNINIETIKILKEVKKVGNLSVHEVLRKITKSYADEIQDKIDLVLEALLVSYNKLNDADIEIESERLEIIEEKIGLRKKNNLEKKQIVNEKKVSNEIGKETEKLQRLFNKLKSMMEKLYKQKKGIGLIFVKTLLRSEELQEYFGIGIDEKEPLDDSTVYFLDGKYSLIPNSKTLILSDPERKILTKNDLPHLQESEILQKLDIFNIDLVNYIKEEYSVELKL